MTKRYLLPLCDFHALIAWSEVNEHMTHKLSEDDKYRSMAEEFRYSQILKREAIEALPRQKRPGYVYFIKVGGQIKIGFASNIYRRIRAYPPTSTLLAYYHGTMEDEQAEHQKFQHCRVGGREWYEARPDLEGHITQLRKRHGVPDLPALAPKRSSSGRQAVSLRGRSGGTFKR